MVNGSWLNGSREPGRGGEGWRAGGGGGPGAPARLPWAMSLEPLAINHRWIEELFNYIWQILNINFYPRFQVSKVPRFNQINPIFIFRKMEQNNYTELLGYSFLNIYNKIDQAKSKNVIHLLFHAFAWLSNAGKCQEKTIRPLASRRWY